jgi:formylglycine-generating enzyme required for sulfatase activity
MGDFGPIHSEEKLPYSGNTDDDVLHEVVLDSYSILAHKVTYADFDVYTDSAGKPRVAMEAQRDKQYRDLAGIAAGVDWNDARAYCQWVGHQIGMPMDVPTEAQWEYAARNRGGLVVYPTDNGKIDNGRNVASFDQAEEFQSSHELSAPMLPVGRYPATPIGLYDMIDGGYEWTLDWYAPQYESAKAHNPQGPKSGTEKVLRGYSTAGGDTLQHVSMTITRNKKPASPPRNLDIHDRPIIANQNRVNTIRCVANSAKRAAANR